MKPASFDYHTPSTAHEAAMLLEEHADEDPKCLAGGQSLVPLMNFRLARPGHVIDLNGVEELKGIESTPSGFRLGALTRHAEVEDSVLLRGELPLLPDVAAMVGYRAIRTRGTFGGAMCHADPVAEWPMIARLLEARFEIVGPSGGRVTPAAEFFVSVFTPDLAPDEVLTAVTLPSLGPSDAWGFSEFARKVGDYAVVAAGVVLEMDGEVVGSARVALSGVAATPARAPRAEQQLVGADPTSEEVRRTVCNTAAEEVDPLSDHHGSSAFRRQLVRAELGRALAQAARNHEEAR